MSREKAMRSFLGSHYGLAEGTKFVDVAFFLDKDWKEVEDWVCKKHKVSTSQGMEG